jgi:ubiquinone/menaquinone biosynthesis C-methylase UbiE
MQNEFSELSFMDSFLNYTDKYSSNRFYHFIKASVVKKFIERNAGHAKIFLDAGAGRGPYTNIAQNKYSKIFCFEYDQNELDCAIKNIENTNETIQFKKVDITDIPLESNTVDVAVCSEVLEHILDYNKAMSELYRVMKPGSTLLFSMPNGNSMLYGLSKIRNRRILAKLDETKEQNKSWEQMRHFSFTHKKIDKIATDAGFRIEGRHGAHVIRLPHKLRSKLMSDFPNLFSGYIKLNNILGNTIPYFGSFYFITLRK